MSVQQLLEEVLFKVIGEKRPIIGCGRTDSGVHARQYFFHVDYKTPLKPGIEFILNKNLPTDIVIFDIIPFDKNYHAQFDATSRTYTYLLHTKKNPFLEGLSHHLDGPFSHKSSVHKAVKILSNYTDYRSFCKTPDKHESTQCTIQKCEWREHPQEKKYQLIITANGFLRGMIRILVHDFIELGQGRMKLIAFREKLENPENATNLKMAPAEGLYLNNVAYPFLELPIPTTLPFEIK